MITLSRHHWRASILASVWCLTASCCLGFTPQFFSSQQPIKPTTARHPEECGPLFSTKKKQRRQSTETENSILDLEEPAGIVGAQFFGGNKEKEEFYDPVAEAQADAEVEAAVTEFDRFQDTTAFSSPLAAKVGQALQQKLNSVLYVLDDASASLDDNIQYASSNLVWESCFDTTQTSPLSGLDDALKFYKSLDVAVVSASQLDDNRVQLQWQISVVWPIFWEPRAVLSGSSVVTIIDDNNDDNAMMTITKQVDTLDSSTDLISTIASQLWPRFWDMYHIGMSPSAEIMPRVEQKQGGILPKSYKVFEIPPRLVSSPTQLDSAAGREDGNAQIVPNHAFSCVIKTMGPQKQDFVPASPVQVQIMPSGKVGPPQLKWSIPLSVEFQTNAKLPLPGVDPEARVDSDPDFEYEFQPRRCVATIPYGGSPQDVEIADTRKKLYDSIIKDGLKPLLDDQGRPQFFFLQNGVKACYTEEGLGMCVYEWRPKAVEPNEVGIELQN